MLLEELREEVCTANRDLPHLGLVAWTSGNVSGRDPASGLVAIKPSGRGFEELTPRDVVVLDLDGRVVDGDLGPSSDTATHLHVYRHRDDVRGMVHTHSTYATAFAAVGRPVPACLTAIADEFGGDIPCGAYASIGGVEIGVEILRSIGTSTAILMRQHGVFTIGSSVRDALKSAVMAEDAARTVAIAERLGTPEVLPPDEVAANYLRYHSRYGTAAASTGIQS
ncbi:L-ribulose-5-phosphate 4-epimerase [Streptomyces sp. YIM S03343]